MGRRWSPCPLPVSPKFIPIGPPGLETSSWETQVFEKLNRRYGRTSRLQNNNNNSNNNNIPLLIWKVNRRRFYLPDKRLVIKV